MIALELARVVVDEPTLIDWHSHTYRSQPVAIEPGTATVARCVYLPQLALVVLVYRDGTAAIVPVEHVHHMTVRGGVDPLELLAEVLP